MTTRDGFASTRLAMALEAGSIAGSAGSGLFQGERAVNGREDVPTATVVDPGAVVGPGVIVGPGVTAGREAAGLGVTTGRDADGVGRPVVPGGR
ncbi:MAG TPA: hypothetical protein VGC94_06520 [Amnibacterium sp.]